jgi:hypothetical protein
MLQYSFAGFCFAFLRHPLDPFPSFPRGNYCFTVGMDPSCSCYLHLLYLYEPLNYLCLCFSVYLVSLIMYQSALILIFFFIYIKIQFVYFHLLTYYSVICYHTLLISLLMHTGMGSNFSTFLTMLHKSFSLASVFLCKSFLFCIHLQVNFWVMVYVCLDFTRLC